MWIEGQIINGVKYGCIYMYRDVPALWLPTYGWRYIGQTARSVELRCSEHESGKSDTHIDCALRERPNDFEFTIIGWYPVDELDYWEKYWISYWDTFEGPGYNHTPGGNTNVGEILRKKVAAKLPDSSEVHIFESIIEVATAIKQYRNLKSSVKTIAKYISMVCNRTRKYTWKGSTRFKTDGFRKSAYGCFFMFLDEYEKNPDALLSLNKCTHPRRPKPVHAVHLETGDEYYFRSMTAAADWLVDTEYNWKGLCAESIRLGINDVVRQKRKQCCGFIFSVA